MRRSKNFGRPLTGKDWLRFRPYGAISPYDSYYLKLAEKVFAHLNRQQSEFRKVFQRDMLKTMAVLLTCHFEDFISEIGLWRTLVHKYREWDGEYLPFYDLEDYDPEYLNRDDFAMLIFHHLGKMANKTLDPYSEPIIAAADFCYDLFEARIDEAPATGFYDDWLTIKPETNFFEVKKRMHWLAFESYLHAPEFGADLKAQLEKMQESESNLMERMDPAKLVYGIQEDFLYQKRSSWGAMSMVEWLAEIAHCSDELRSDIRNLKQRVTGMFLYDGADEKNYYFIFLPSNRRFPVHRDSINLQRDRLQPGDDVAFFSIVNWRGEWWLSGTYMHYGSRKKMGLEDMAGDPKWASFYAEPEERRRRMRQMTEEMDAAFVEYFGSRLVFFENDKELMRKIEAFHKWWNEYRTLPDEPGREESKLKKQLLERRPEPETLDFGNQKMAAFYEPEQGVMMSPVIPEIISRMQNKELSVEESQELFYSFFYELSPELAHYLIHHFPADNLEYPLQYSSEFVIDHLNYFLRYYNPSGFAEPLPRLNFLPEE